MTTKTRPELSKKNEFWISKHRFYELKHFCMQYPEWKRQIKNFDGLKRNQSMEKVKNSNKSDPTATSAIYISLLNDKIKIIEKAAKSTDAVLYDFIIKAVTEELSYNYLRTYLNIPCSKDVYYKLYRKFFSILDKLKK